MGDGKKGEGEKESEEERKKIERIEELRYEISKRTAELYRIKIAKDYDKEKEIIKKYKKEFDTLCNSVGKYILFEKERIEELKKKFSELSDSEKKKILESGEGLVKEIDYLLKRNFDNRKRIAKIVLDLSNISDISNKNEYQDIKDFFEGRKNYVKISKENMKKIDFENLKEICSSYGYILNKSIFGDVELKRIVEKEKKEEKKEDEKKEKREEEKEKEKERKIFDLKKIISFFSDEKKKKKQEIESEIKEVEAEINKILNDQKMKRFSLGIFENEEEKKFYEEKQKELLELIKKKRELKKQLNSL